jgi:hypothetical protein
MSLAKAGENNPIFGSKVYKGKILLTGTKALISLTKYKKYFFIL